MTARQRVGLLLPGLLIGIGLGGFVDGIVFHQILQTHNMLSARIPVTDLISAKTNMVWDGLFHAGVWIISVIGLILLIRSDYMPSGRSFWGSWLFGWGLFNLVEGVIDHQILNLHHVLEYATPRNQSIADWAFLASGLIFMVIGWAVAHRTAATT